MTRVKDLTLWQFVTLVLSLLVLLLFTAVLISDLRELAGSLLSGAIAALLVVLATTFLGYKDERRLAQQTLREIDRYAKFARYQLRNPVNEAPRDQCEEVRWDIIELRQLAEQLIRLRTRSSGRPDVPELILGRSGDPKSGVDGTYRHWRGQAIMGNACEARAARRDLQAALDGVIEATALEGFEDPQPPREIIAFPAESFGPPAGDDRSAGVQSSSDARWKLDGAVDEVGPAAWRVALLVDLNSGKVHTAGGHMDIYERLAVNRVSGHVTGEAYLAGLRWHDFGATADERTRATEILRSWLQLT
jgi:hypothetical protein